MRPILLLLALATVTLGCWRPPCRGWCRHDFDCPEDSICNGRKCDKWTLDAAKRHSRPACSENDDCPADQQCVAGNCEPIWDTLDANKRHPRPECGEDSDCPADSICVSGSCQKWRMDVATRSRRSDDVIHDCSVDTDCRDAAAYCFHHESRGSWCGPRPATTTMKPRS